MERINTTNLLEENGLREQLIKVDLSKDTYERGGVVLSSDKEYAFVDGTDSHSIVFGATGSKKTRLLVMPTVEVLKRAGESFIVTDPKGEIYQRTAAGLEERGYNIIPINLRDFEKGISWNPLTLPYDYYHEGMEAKALELSGSIADMILDDITSTDPYWGNMARDVIMGMLLLLYSTASRDECNIKSLINLWNLYREGKRDFLKNISDRYPGSTLEVKLACLDTASDKTVGSIEAVVIGGINKLTLNEKFVKFLSQESVDFNRISKEKTAIYMIIPDENRYYHMVASLLIMQIYEILIRDAQKREDRTLPIRQNFIIDEFANLPKIANMDSMITASRSRNIRFTLIVQSMSQLRDKYAEAEIITSNCNNWIYLYSKEYELLNMISKLCGEVIFDNGMKMPLFSEFDLQHLNKDNGEALILNGRNLPCIVKMLDIDDYPFEKKKVEFVSRELKDVHEVSKNSVFFNVKDADCKLYQRIPVDDIKRHIIDFNDYFNARTWVVITYDNIILYEFTFANKDNSEKIKVLGEMIRKYDDYGASKLKWYSADLSMRKIYTGLISEHPEEVFVKINELEQLSDYRFEPYDNPYQKLKIGNHCSILIAADSVRWIISLTEKTKDKESTKITLTELNKNRSETSYLDIECILKNAFRLANRHLRDSELADAAWSSNKIKPYNYTFSKRTLDKSVELEIELIEGDNV